jgi:hypothetical protein
MFYPLCKINGLSINLYWAKNSLGLFLLLCSSWKINYSQILLKNNAGLLISNISSLIILLDLSSFGLKEEKWEKKIVEVDNYEPIYQLTIQINHRRPCTISLVPTTSTFVWPCYRSTDNNEDNFITIFWLSLLQNSWESHTNGAN